MTRTNNFSKKKQQKKRNTSKCSPAFTTKFAYRLKSARENISKTQEEVAEEMRIECRTYQHYESATESNGRVPNLETVSNLSHILKCDITYLTGENEEDIFQKDTKNASEETELNYKTIEKIKKYPSEVKQLIDRLVLHTNGDNLLKLLNAVHAYSLESHNAYIKIDVPGADRFETYDIEEKLVNASPSNPLKDISKKMLKYSVSSTLDEILTDTYNDYIKDGNLLLRKRLEKEGAREKAAVKRVFEQKEAGIQLTTPEDFRLYYGNSIDNHEPTLNERYKQIDEKVSSLYKLYRESSKNS